jgi:hypothetical protein
LTSSVNKILTQIEVSGGLDNFKLLRGSNASRPKISPDDLKDKLEKLSNELTSIDTELFELEKKYGEYQRPKVIYNNQQDIDLVDKSLPSEQPEPIDRLEEEE